MLASFLGRERRINSLCLSVSFSALVVLIVSFAGLARSLSTLHPPRVRRFQSPL